jgi:hypothetical protein
VVPDLVLGATAARTSSSSSTAGTTGFSRTAGTAWFPSTAGTTGFSGTTNAGYTAGSTRLSGTTNATHTASTTGSSGTTDAARTTSATSAEFIGCRLIPIWSVSAMLRIVLKLTSLLAVEVVVLIEIIVVVDVDIAAAPIAIAPVTTPSAPSGGTHRNSRAPRQSRPWHVARIGIRVVRILGRRRTVNDLWVVRRDINYVRVSLLDLDHLLAAGNCLGFHYLLGAGL